jgi:iron complex transport system ATP-binding protein
MLELKRATYVVRGRPLVEAIDLALEPGRIVALAGPNGAGKSTVMRLFAGEIHATTGDAHLDGRPLRSVPASEQARRRAVVPQASVLSFPFTVLEAVLMGATVPGFGIAGSRGRAAALGAIEAMDLLGFEERFYTELSGGERQRVAVARALCQLEAAGSRPGETTALLLDEPTANLDLAHQGVVLGEARRQAARGRAVLAILHDLNLAALYADEIVLMSGGRIAAQGAAGDVLTDDILSEVYGCPVRTNVTPAAGAPFILPSLGPPVAPGATP